MTIGFRVSNACVSQAHMIINCFVNIDFTMSLTVMAMKVDLTRRKTDYTYIQIYNMHTKYTDSLCALRVLEK